MRAITTRLLFVESKLKRSESQWLSGIASENRKSDILFAYLITYLVVGPSNHLPIR